MGGKGVIERWKANKSSYANKKNKNKTFRKRISCVRKYREGGDRVFVFARTSDCQEIFGQCVPRCHAEEIAAYNKFNPPLNSQGFASCPPP